MKKPLKQVFLSLLASAQMRFPSILTLEENSVDAVETLLT